MKLILLLSLLSISSVIVSKAQDSSCKKTFQSINTISDRALHVMDNKYSFLDKMIQRKTEKLLHKMQKQELALQKKLQQTDSTQANKLFAGTQTKYKNLLVQLKSPIDKNINNPLKEYIPGLDSIQTALHFLENNNINLPIDKLQNLQAISKQIREVQGSMQKANDIQQFIKEREIQLKSQLENSGMGKQLTSINKQAFYYQQQIAEYKNLLNDKKKLERKLLASVSELPAFKEFMKKNSYLGQLFGLPADYGSATSLIGLQTRNDVQQLLAQRFGSVSPGSSGSSNAGQFVSQQLQGAQQQIQQVQNQVSYLGLGGGSNKDLVMPDFKPNNQKTKSFFKRIVLGSSFSTRQSTGLTPTISDIGLTAGYKLNDKSIVGIRANYKLGLGKGLDHISFSSEGVGFGGFVDIKAKRSIWISGGFEYNYFKSFKNFEALYNFDIWQKSALIGITKKYKISGKKGGSLQLLHDMLYMQHKPQSQPFVYRMGFNL